MYRVAASFASILALAALSSDKFLSTNPSPLHSEQMPEPAQSSQVFIGISEVSEALDLWTRRVAAAPTAMAVTIIDAAVSGKAVVWQILRPPPRK